MAWVTMQAPRALQILVNFRSFYYQSHQVLGVPSGQWHIPTSSCETSVRRSRWLLPTALDSAGRSSTFSIDQLRRCFRSRRFECEDRLLLRTLQLWSSLLGEKRDGMIRGLVKIFILDKRSWKSPYLWEKPSPNGRSTVWYRVTHIGLREAEEIRRVSIAVSWQ